MQKNATPAAQRNKRSNLLVAAGGVAMVLSMAGLSYAAVPLYELFCRVTGYGGTTQRAETYADRVLDRTITVRFDANTAGVPWEFRPERRQVTIRVGETAKVNYRADSIVSSDSRGTATFNVTPPAAGAYFNKVQCFCFTDTTLAAGEGLDMPVVFYIDPDIADAPELDHIRTITLSYTFFPVDGAAEPVASASVDGETLTNSTKQ